MCLRRVCSDWVNQSGRVLTSDSAVSFAVFTMKSSNIDRVSVGVRSDGVALSSFSSLMELMKSTIFSLKALFPEARRIALSIFSFLSAILFLRLRGSHFEFGNLRLILRAE